MKSGVPGVGLGLAFVRTVVLNHKGKIAVWSQPGDTTFQIRLKRCRETGTGAVVTDAVPGQVVRS